MKRTFQLSFLIVLLMSVFLTSTAYAAATAETKVSVIIDNIPVSFSDESGIPFTNENGHTLIPLRSVMQAYGCTVQWDSDTNSILVIKNDTVVLIPIGTSYIFVNGIASNMDTPAIQKNNHIYLDISPVLKAFGATTKWIDKNLIVSSPLSDYFEDISIDKQGNLIFEFQNGKTINAGKVTGEKGNRGSSGSDGISVIDAYINSDGDLIFTLSNNRTINAGTVSTSSEFEISPKSFKNYDIGTKWYLLQPTGDFEVDILVDSAPVTVYFDEVYYELTAKNDFYTESAWRYKKNEHLYIPYEVTIHISGQTDSSLAGERLYVVFHDDTLGTGYGYHLEIDNSGEFYTSVTHGIDDSNVWYKPKELYFQKIFLE